VRRILFYTPIGPCTTNPSVHSARLRLGGTPHALFSEDVRPVQNGGCLAHIGSGMVDRQRAIPESEWLHYL